MDVVSLSSQLEHIVFLLQGILQLNLALITLIISIVIVYIFFFIFKSFIE